MHVFILPWKHIVNHFRVINLSKRKTMFFGIFELIVIYKACNLRDNSFDILLLALFHFQNQN